MKLVLCHISALLFWRSMQASITEHSDASSINGVIDNPPHLNQKNAKRFESLGYPLHTLISNKSYRRRNRKIVCHTWSGPLLKGSIMEAGEGIFVCSPEFCFIQMAKSSSLLALIELGYELCGRYYVSKNNVVQIEPLTTLVKLRSFVSRTNNAHGIKKASRALQYITENSASPMETRLTMLLTLPYKLGGYGLTKPILNYRVDLGSKQPGKYYVCDLMWPKTNLALEYDSDLHHADKNSISRDSIKRVHLASIGITVYSVTRFQIQSRSEMTVLARLIAKHLEKTLRCPEPYFSKARYELRKTLRLIP